MSWSIAEPQLIQNEKILCRSRVTPLITRLLTVSNCWPAFWLEFRPATAAKSLLPLEESKIEDVGMKWRNHTQYDVTEVVDDVEYHLLLVRTVAARGAHAIVTSTWPTGRQPGYVSTVVLCRVYTRIGLHAVFTCIPCRYPRVSCIGDKIVVNVALRRHCIHLYPDTSCSSGILISTYMYPGVNAALEQGAFVPDLFTAL